MNSCFYNPAYRMLSHLSGYSETNFWSVKIEKASILIRDALFCSADVFGQSFDASLEICSVMSYCP